MGGSTVGQNGQDCTEGKKRQGANKPEVIEPLNRGLAQGDGGVPVCMPRLSESPKRRDEHQLLGSCLVRRIKVRLSTGKGRGDSAMP